MAEEKAKEAHRASLKQQNKSHKTGRHRSKGFIQRDAKGRVNVQEISKKKKGLADKHQRRTQVQQVRKMKRDEVLKEKRQRGTATSPPFLVAVIGLSDDDSLVEPVMSLMSACEGTTVTQSESSHHVSVARFKQRFAFVFPPRQTDGDLSAVLDAVKPADCLLLVVNAGSGVDPGGERLLACLCAQGLPATAVCVQGLNAVPVKKQAEVKTDTIEAIKSKVSVEKVHSLDSAQDATLLLRVIGSQRLVRMRLRENRPHVIAERAQYQSETTAEDGTSLGTLRVSGYIRGRPLSVNCLIHISGFGDFQMLRIDGPSDPHPLNAAARQRGKNVEMLDESNQSEAVLESCDPARQDSLAAEAEVDEMDAEQTFPSEQELAEADERARASSGARVSKVQVPKGTSDYQAAWITDDVGETGEHSGDEDSESDNEKEMALGMGVADDDADSHDSDSDAADDTMSHADDTESRDTAGNDKYDMATDDADDAEMLEKFRAARLDRMFPDEVDTPLDTTARVRFQKYRGLKSFRTSPWDPREDLPSDYARLFQFENFGSTRRRVIAAARTDAEAPLAAQPGRYVTIHVKNVPSDAIAQHQSGRPLILFGLLPHEQKMSVVHFLITRGHSDVPDGEEAEPIKSKEQMIFHVGYRRFSAAPIYSEHSNASKHKAERYLQVGVPTVATVFCPIIFPPATVLMFKDTGRQQELIATGTVLSVDPQRIISKRIVLTGHPFKVNKNSATVRYMFFNREDILWFKPVELRSKWGRHGHIREPLGTHGHMKCVFDHQLKSEDTVMMSLYKRVYPKWTYDPRPAPHPRPLGSGRRSANRDDDQDELFA